MDVVSIVLVIMMAVVFGVILFLGFANTYGVLSLQKTERKIINVDKDIKKIKEKLCKSKELYESGNISSVTERNILKKIISEESEKLYEIESYRRFLEGILKDEKTERAVKKTRRAEKSTRRKLGRALSKIKTKKIVR